MLLVRSMTCWFEAHAETWETIRADDVALRTEFPKDLLAKIVESGGQCIPVAMALVKKRVQALCGELAVACPALAVLNNAQVLVLEDLQRGILTNPAKEKVTHVPLLRNGVTSGGPSGGTMGEGSQRNVFSVSRYPGSSSVDPEIRKAYFSPSSAPPPPHRPLLPTARLRSAPFLLVVRDQVPHMTADLVVIRDVLKNASLYTKAPPSSGAAQLLRQSTHARIRCLESGHAQISGKNLI